MPEYPVDKRGFPYIRTPHNRDHTDCGISLPGSFPIVGQPISDKGLIIFFEFVPVELGDIVGVQFAVYCLINQPYKLFKGLLESQIRIINSSDPLSGMHKRCDF